MTHERTMQQLLNTSNKRKGGSGSARLGDGSLPRLRPNPNTSPFLSPSSPASPSSMSYSASSSPLFEDPFNDSDCEPLFASVITYVGGASPSPSSVAHATYHHFLPTSLSQMASTSTLRQRVGDEVCMNVSSNINSYTMTHTSISIGKDELQQQPQRHEQVGSQGIFKLMDAKVRQLAQAVFEFNRALDTTALRPYFGDVGKQLQLMSQDTNKRLSEVSTYYNWLRQHNTPIGATPAGYFSILPEELNMYILSFLNVRELASVELVSRYWRRLAEDDQIWHSMHRARWGRDAHGLLIRQMSFEGSGSASDSGEEEAQCQAESRRAKRKRRGWKDIYIDGNRLEKNWKGGKYSTKLVKRSVQAQESAYCIKFDDHRMVTGSNDRCVRLLDIKSGHVLHTLAGHTAEVRSVDFDTTKIASGSRDRAVKVWDINTGQCLLSMDDHAGPVKCMQMTDNIIMSGSEDASIKMLDLNSGKVVNTFNGHVWGVACLQFKDNYIVSGSRDRRVFLWDKRITPSHIASDRPKQCLRVMEGHSNTVRCVAFNEETIVSGSWDNTIKVWSTKTGKLKNTLDGHDGRVLHLDFDQYKIVSGSVDKTVRVWWDYEATAAPPITYSLHMHQAPIFHVRFNDYGIRSAARDTELIEWDFYTPSLEDVHKTRRALLRPI